MKYMIDFRRYLTTAEKRIIVMENALQRHFSAILFSSRVLPKFIVGIYVTSNFVNYLQRCLPVRVH